jgi:hypothetical protein
MTPTTVRDTAAELAGRIKVSRIDPAKADEAGRPPEDRPPAFADALMSEKPTSVGRGAKLTDADWDLIQQALLHYAACGGA